MNNTAIRAKKKTWFLKMKVTENFTRNGYLNVDIRNIAFT